jgi:hypothetical protein
MAGTGPARTQAGTPRRGNNPAPMDEACRNVAGGCITQFDVAIRHRSIGPIQARFAAAPLEARLGEAACPHSIGRDGIQAAKHPRFGRRDLQASWPVPDLEARSSCGYFGADLAQCETLSGHIMMVPATG